VSTAQQRLTLRQDGVQDTGAEFSPCRAYRYRLWRFWGPEKPCCFIMLNPSTADEVANDPTVERCERRARSMGHGGLIVVNLFAFRATDPAEMKRQADPIGPGNGEAILKAAQDSDRVICAWGNHGTYLGRSRFVREMLRMAGVQPQILALNSSGEPKHPLYVNYAVQPKRWI
jgi:hypothetical protein